MNYLKASVEIIASNQRAISLFQKFGFVVEGRRLNHIRINDIYCDEILMGLDLNRKQASLANPKSIQQLFEEEAIRNAIA